jgi:hypothetical protein
MIGAAPTPALARRCSWTTKVSSRTGTGGVFAMRLPPPQARLYAVGVRAGSSNGSRRRSEGIRRHQSRLCPRKAQRGGNTQIATLATVLRRQVARVLSGHGLLAPYGRRGVPVSGRQCAWRQFCDISPRTSPRRTQALELILIRIVRSFNRGRRRAGSA